MNNRRRTAAALGVGGVIVAVILWQWLTAPVEWGPADAVIRQTGLKLVSCPWVPLKRIRPDTSCDLPPVGESFVCRWPHGGRGAVRPAVAGGVRRWAVGPPAAPGRLAGRILQTVFERRETLGGDTTTLAIAQGQGQRGGGWWCEGTFRRLTAKPQTGPTAGDSVLHGRAAVVGAPFCFN